MRGQDLNLRPSGYEPDELPDCSTPQWTGTASRHPLATSAASPNTVWWQRQMRKGRSLAGPRPAPGPAPRRSPGARRRRRVRASRGRRGGTGSHGGLPPGLEARMRPRTREGPEGPAHAVQGRPRLGHDARGRLCRRASSSRRAAPSPPVRSSAFATPIRCSKPWRPARPGWKNPRPQPGAPDARRPGAFQGWRSGAGPRSRASREATPIVEPANRRESAPPTGIEPVACSLGNYRSIQLSYGSVPCRY